MKTIIELTSELFGLVFAGAGGPDPRSLVLLLQVLQLSVFPLQLCSGGDTGVKAELDSLVDGGHLVPAGVSDSLVVGPDLGEALQHNLRKTLGGHQ